MSADQKKSGEGISRGNADAEPDRDTQLQQGTDDMKLIDKLASSTTSKPRMMLYVEQQAYSKIFKDDAKESAHV